MKKTGWVLFLGLLLASCGHKGPDVSNIQVPLQLERFDQDFFALDTNRLLEGLDQLDRKYPEFLKDYLYNILGLPPLTDTSLQTEMALKQFLRDYRPVKDSCDLVFTHLDQTEADIRNGLQHVKYYFPRYKLPTRIICFIGPMDAYFNASMGSYGDILTSEGLGVGLQLHLGSKFSMYLSEMGQSLYPAYISRRFTPAYIPVNCIKNIIDDIYPENNRGKSLLEMMVEKGKRMYVLDKLMPETADTLKIGYTATQLKGCFQNEGKIWNFFLSNSLLNSTEQGLMKGYINDAPNTPEFGEGSPGYIGLFCGWRIVQKYMKDHADMPLDSLLHMDARKIYEESKYRPR